MMPVSRDSRRQMKNTALVSRLPRFDYNGLTLRSEVLVHLTRMNTGCVEAQTRAQSRDQRQYVHGRP